MGQQICLCCGDALPKGAPGQTRYCSERCRAVYRGRAKPYVDKACGYCGVAFRATPDSNQRYCSSKCKRAARTVSEKLKSRERRSPEERRVAQNAARRKWRAANPEKYQASRRREAEKKGKSYRPGVPAYVAAYIVRYGVELTPAQIEKRIAERKAKKDAIRAERAEREAIKKKKESMTDEEMKQYYEELGKPWLNPRLTDAEQWRLKYKLDPQFAIHERMRRQLRKAATNDSVAALIRGALVRNGESPKTTELLGYTITELRQHLERQFTKGMTWEIFLQGKIHIDHIHPKTLFDLTDPDQWAICWSLPNLRPMWAADNLTKRAKVLTLL